MHVSRARKLLPRQRNTDARSFLPLERVEDTEIAVLDHYPRTDYASRLWYRLTCGRVVGEGHGVGGVVGISKG